MDGSLAGATPLATPPPAVPPVVPPGADADRAALEHLLGAISDALDAREVLPSRVGRAYNAVLAGRGAERP